MTGLVSSCYLCIHGEGYKRLSKLKDLVGVMPLLNSSRTTVPLILWKSITLRSTSVPLMVPLSKFISSTAGNADLLQILMIGPAPCAISRISRGEQHASNAKHRNLVCVTTCLYHARLVLIIFILAIAESTAEMRLDGKSDECPQQAPSPFLVIRDLPSSANENTLSNGIKSLYVAKGDEPKQTPGAPPKLKSTAPVGNTSGLGAKPGSLVRVFLIRERSSEISCNYGFVEFATLEDARAAMAKYLATPQFTISSRPVTLAYIHSGVFIPHLYPVQEHDKYSFAATHNPSMRLVYWNPSVFASELTVFNESLYEDKPQGSAASQRDAEQAAKDTKKRKAEKELAAPSGKKVIAMAPQLQRWANKHAELHSSKEGSKLKEPPNDKTPATGPNAVGSTQASRASPPAPSTAPSISYADLDQMCCLLCRRKFRNEPSLRRHEQSSDMHKANLDNEGLISKATTDLKALGKEPVSNYRDRAKERRRVHNQPMKPKPQLPKKNPTPSTKEKDAAPAKPVISKGAGLLAKMGWNSGEGLGAEGGGRTNLVETLAYNPGVGLGAEGGKLGDAAEEAARATTNEYSDFVAKAKDKARERYERMG